MSSDEPSTGIVETTSPGHSCVRISPNAAAGINLQERERVRIGFDLHDGPAQTMSAALLQVRMLEDLEGEALHNGLAELRVTIAAGLEEIYELIERLGGRESQSDDLSSRVTALVESFRSRSDVGIGLSIEGEAGPLSPSMQIAVARIVQEALSNVSRHSRATRVDVRLDLLPEEVRCEVSDNGRGFALDGEGASRRAREPFGLHSMSERARLLDGECIVYSSPGAGTRVVVRIPVWRP